MEIKIQVGGQVSPEVELFRGRDGRLRTLGRFVGAWRGEVFRKRIGHDNSLDNSVLQEATSFQCAPSGSNRQATPV
jgi:hypothetical protein